VTKGEEGAVDRVELPERTHPPEDEIAQLVKRVAQGADVDVRAETLRIHRHRSHHQSVRPNPEALGLRRHFL
jgi:hypothetical protein